MKLSTSLVAVKKLTSSKSRSIFTNDDLEQAAQLILNSEGVVNPIIVRRNGLQSYEVVDGDFEYYAAARAREIDPRKGEMIGVFIIEEENEEALIEQIKVFRNQKDDTKKTVNITPEYLEKFLNDLELRIEKLSKGLLEESTAKLNLENQNKELKKKLAEKVTPLEVFTKLDFQKIAQKLINVGFPQKKAGKIAETVIYEREKEEFKSLNDVIERVKIPHGKKMLRAINSEKMIAIIESLYRED
ncbi:hypothetical protein [Anabaena sp. CCY 9910]|uniref:ParB N-terminal domain-containing protein n=1 Tax=Anabaena sp. CCY 9910 TaxID=3103870 RepID=UPI0039DFBD7F